MKRILTIALITFVLVRAGVIEVPQSAIDWFSNVTASPASAQMVEAPRTAGETAPPEHDPIRFPLQKPRGAFLQMLFDLFNLKSVS